MPDVATVEEQADALIEEATGTPAETSSPTTTTRTADDASEAPEAAFDASDGTPAGDAASGLLSTSVVKGRIKVADEVVEKVAALAALEIPGVADLGGDFERAFESVRDRIGVGSKRATQGVRAQIENQQVAVDVTIVIVYGHVVMDVAAEVKVNVARSVSRMLGMRVVEVNVTVDDVRLPGEGRAEHAEDDAA
ncbi:Asp23/Gls24 family envelope stress response protein [Microtetraspora sp. AC03309]|uniref:Asp23/Gls24 family envelope stress response protein n=1 Tax=Microtetraspora sp. AC03309 TaxID=2779376 RepID=UPI001E4EE53D|nr:Asp23/Gls24 family envelope stress response protein [Microtetraspora sp. AC03309]MCC5579365.1 Asp23/Gls24 family envelope stress response protein [Microtetraspora sp. AC03309]